MKNYFLLITLAVFFTNCKNEYQSEINYKLGLNVSVDKSMLKKRIFEGVEVYAYERKFGNNDSTEIFFFNKKARLLNYIKSIGKFKIKEKTFYPDGSLYKSSEAAEYLIVHCYKEGDDSVYGKLLLLDNYIEKTKDGKLVEKRFFDGIYNIVTPSKNAGYDTLKFLVHNLAQCGVDSVAWGLHPIALEELNRYDEPLNYKKRK